MSERPNWIARKRRKVRRAIFRRFVLPQLNRELQDAGVTFYRYDEQVDRLHATNPVRWESLTRAAGESAPENRWYAALRDRRIRCAIILDVGAGGGATSTWFSRWAEQVIAFEPSPKNRASICIHHKIRGVTNVEVVPAAVSDRCGEATLHHKENPGHNALSDVGASATVERIPVAVTTLDTFAEERSLQRAGLLKIDVEGFEPEVIRGADRLLRERRIDLVVFEFSPEFYTRRELEALAPIDELEARGYRVRHIDGSPIDREQLKRSRQTDLIAEPAPASRCRTGAGG